MLIRGKMKMRRTCVVEREKGEPREAHIDLKAFTEVENWWWKPQQASPPFSECHPSLPRGKEMVFGQARSIGGVPFLLFPPPKSFELCHLFLCSPPGMPLGGVVHQTAEEAVTPSFGAAPEETNPVVVRSLTRRQIHQLFHNISKGAILLTYLW